MASQPVHALREMLGERFPGALPVVHRQTPIVSSGVGALDRALPNGGFPRGRVVVWRPGGGASAILRCSCEELAAGGERAAWIDGHGVVTGEGWPADVALFRPRDGKGALSCAEELIRSEGFGMVVLSGVRVEDTERVRLSRAAREGGGVLALLDRGGFMASVRLASRIGVEGYRWRRDAFGDPAEVESVEVRAHVGALGWTRETRFPLDVTTHDLRLSLEPSLVDRRGVAR